jgi:Myb-like DNA-binding domain
MDPSRTIRKSAKWSFDEDERLREAVERFGDGSWRKVADFVQTRDNGNVSDLSAFD